MPDLQSILSLVPAFAVVLARLTGLFLFSPLLSSTMMPRRFKAMLVLVLAFCVFPIVGADRWDPIPLEFTVLGPMIAMELLIGVAIGIIMLTPLWGVQLAGTFMGQQMGLSLAPIYNPATDIEGDTLGQLLFLMALSLFIVLGGVEAMWDGVVRSFALVAPGAFRADDTLLRTLAAMLASGFHLAMRVSMPVMAIVLVETVAVGFITKTLPTLNIMSFGFPVRILLGFAVLAAAMAGVHGAIAADTSGTMEALQGWIDTLGPEAAPESASAPSPPGGR